MNQNAIFMPVFALVLLTLFVWLRMYYIRISLTFRENIDIQTMKKDNPELPVSFLSSGDNLTNLFEMPILFYAAVAYLHLTQSVDQTYLILSWAFVGLRYVHSLIHTTYNRVLHRFLIYVFSSMVVWAIWIRFFLAIWMGQSSGFPAST